MERKNRIPITRLNEFYNQTDFDFDIEIGQEIVHGDANFRLILYRIDRINTNYDDVYGETKKDQIIYKAPVEINVILTILPSVKTSYNKNGSLRTENFGNLEFVVYNKELEMKNVDITYGDIIGYAWDENNLVYFSVSDPNYLSDSTQMLYNYKTYFKKSIK
jgi:hypothetical protein